MEKKKDAKKSSTARVKVDKARIDRLKEQLRSTPAEVDFERVRIMAEVYEDTAGYQQIIRRAKFMATLLEQEEVVHRRQPLRGQHGKHRQWHLHLSGMATWIG